MSYHVVQEQELMNDIAGSKPGWLWFALGSALFAAATAILGKVGVSEVSSNVATFIRVVVMLVVMTGLLSVRGEWAGIASVSAKNLWIVIASGLATGLSWLCYFRALQLAPASKVAPIDKLSVALVIVCGVLFLGESLTWQGAAGAALIVAGVLLLSLS
jgi:transporter family protein